MGTAYIHAFKNNDLIMPSPTHTKITTIILQDSQSSLQINDSPRVDIKHVNWMGQSDK